MIAETGRFAVNDDSCPRQFAGQRQGSPTSHFWRQPTRLAVVMPLFLAYSVALADEVRRDNTGEPLLVVSVQSERNAGLYVLNEDGTVVGQLTTNGGDLLPAWSPDGKTLAFLALRDQDLEANERFNLAFHWFVYVVDADGKHLRRVTDTPVGMRFQWSPNGKQFLFQSSYEDVPNRGKDGVLSSAIYVTRADGKHRQRLAKQVGNVSGFAVYPRR